MERGHKMDIGITAIDEVYKLWQVDEKWSTRQSRGFTWWAGDFRQCVYVDEGRIEGNVLIYRLSAVTDFARSVDSDSPNTATMIAILNRFSSVYALTLYSPERLVRLCSSVVVHEQVSTWMVHHFAALAIIQVIDAQIRAQEYSKIIGGAPDQSQHPGSGIRSTHDDMLNVMETIYHPEGMKPCRWIGSGEFEHVATQLKQNGLFVNSGESGLAAETVFGDDSALITVAGNEPHPQLGQGILFRLSLPITLSEITAARMALELNRAEAALTFSYLCGAWTSMEVAGAYVLVFVSFLPNALYKPKLLSNLVKSLLVKSHWARVEMAPYLIDGNLEDVLKRRYGIE